jgi:hypothetical protein
MYKCKRLSNTKSCSNSLAKIPNAGSIPASYCADSAPGFSLSVLDTMRSVRKVGTESGNLINVIHIVT